MESTRSLSAVRFTESVGRLMLPEGPSMRGRNKLLITRRAGLVSLIWLVTGLAATAIGVTLTLINPDSFMTFRDSNDSGHPEIAIAFVLISVFAPQAVFRTRSRIRTEQLLSDPSTPMRRWDQTTLTFDAMLIGAMLAGLYYNPGAALGCFGLALTVRVAIACRRTKNHVAPYDAIRRGWSALAIAVVAYLVVRPLAGSVIEERSMVPFLLAGVIAMCLQIAVNAVDRWVRLDAEPWALGRDVMDARRIVIAVVSAGIAWMVCATGEWVSHQPGPDAVMWSVAAGLAVYVGSWFVLWIVSIVVWRAEALRILRLWGDHQARILARMSDGSLDPALVARAASTTTARMGMSIYGARGAVVRLADGSTPQSFTVDQDAVRVADAGALLTGPYVSVDLQLDPLQLGGDSIFLAGLNAPGRFLRHSRLATSLFRKLAMETLTVPEIANRGTTSSVAFASMFDSGIGLPTLSAFVEAVSRMRELSDSKGSLSSVTVGVFGVEDFVGLTEGRLDRSVISNLALEISRQAAEFGAMSFVAYENPGQVWAAFHAGPMARNSVAALQNARDAFSGDRTVAGGAISLNAQISLGTAVYQVDELGVTDLLQVARDRCAADRQARNPLLSMQFSGVEREMHDFGPEDIIGADKDRLAPSDLYTALSEDRSSDEIVCLLTPIVNIGRHGSDALMVDIGWNHRIGSVDLSDPANFIRAVNRQTSLAALAAEIIIDHAQLILGDADGLGFSQALVVVSMPALLLHPDAGVYALPNIAGSRMDLRESARTVLLFDAVPHGSGQALRLLADRGFHIALTAGAAATADPMDLTGWRRWGLIVGSHVLDGPRGIDALTIQQTLSALAGVGTRVIGMVDGPVDEGSLKSHQINWVIDSRQSSVTFDDTVSVLASD